MSEWKVGQTVIVKEVYPRQERHGARVGDEGIVVSAERYITQLKIGNRLFWFANLHLRAKPETPALKFNVGDKVFFQNKNVEHGPKVKGVVTVAGNADCCFDYRVATDNSEAPGILAFESELTPRVEREFKFKVGDEVVFNSVERPYSKINGERGVVTEVRPSDSVKYPYRIETPSTSAGPGRLTLESELTAYIQPKYKASDWVTIIEGPNKGKPAIVIYSYGTRDYLSLLVAGNRITYPYALTEVEPYRG